MGELKTRPTSRSVTEFIRSVEPAERRKECRTVMKIMREVTGARPRMWGDSIVGYGSYHYKYASGREGDWFVAGFSPRKQALTLYIMSGFENYHGLLKKLGKHATGRSCLYLRRLEDVDLEVLREMISRSVAHVSRSG